MAETDFSEPIIIHAGGEAYLLTIEQSADGDYYSTALRIADNSSIEIQDNLLSNPDDARAYTIGWIQMRAWDNHWMDS